MAECFWPDVREEAVVRAAARIQERAAELTDAGDEVQLTGSILVPDDEIVFYLFSGSAAAVRETCTRAQVPFERVVESVWTMTGRGNGG
jgi:hypothetical protein